MTGADSGAVRVDQWLWAVRVVKTRTLATQMAKSGHVRINKEPVKPATKVHVGDEVRVRIQGFDKIFVVQKLLKKRVGAPVARTCYEDLSPARPRLYIPVAKREPGSGRPTKRERRQLDKLRGHDPNWDRR
ncbi:RNA-binding S4 domain-containing protein [Winkia neuii]|uniref:RNA-binding S4 domain-containing protein n=1 Tax=Winkia TaxID=2692118 RepID=UPI0014313315|nr:MULTISPECIES: RNA-binding S4 domain-containing protein [Winkia]MDK7185916.1 RNA-binding S4 domain-containing protein [Winkia sp. UMB1295B]NJJ15485.1 RNA-binding S4 domain-containing protein [Winkia neuii]